MNRKFIRDLHRSICQHYMKEYGGLVGQLESWNFNFVECVTIPEIKVVVDKYDPNSSDENLVPDAFKELVVEGYLEEKEWGYTLSEVGLREGTQGKIKKVINYLNLNPGLAIVMSLISLIVSIGALYIAYTKP